MINNANQRGQVLIILMTSLFLGGSSLALGVATTGMTLKDIEKSIKIHVQDTSKQQQSLALLKQWKKEGKTLNKQFNKKRVNLLKLMNLHGANRADLELATKEILDIDQQASKRILDINFELRGTMTKQEWESIFSGSNK
jgi:DNA-binding transcriptional MerR regulator